MKVPIHQAKAQLSRLIQKACDGEEIVISRGREPVARLVPVKHERPQRKFGALRGKLRVDPTFFEPLPDEEIAAWEK